MILADYAIREAIEQNELSISPLDSVQVQPASVDLRLGGHYLKIDEEKTTHIDLDTPLQYRQIQADRFVLPAGAFVLATTREYIRLPDNLTAFVEGRSSIGRMGLFVQNAGWVDPGFHGEITLELYNAGSSAIELSKGRRICQLVFCKMVGKAQRPYAGKYLGQTSATGSQVYNDSDRT